MLRNTRNLAVMAVITFAITSAPYGRAQHEHDNSTYHAEMTAQMAKMDKDMKAAPMTGNPDIDFASMMIPHHQGAIDMAKTQLKYGKDEKLRAMATAIIESQEKEIKEMQERIKELKQATAGSTASNAAGSSATMPHTGTTH